MGSWWCVGERVRGVRDRLLRWVFDPAPVIPVTIHKVFAGTGSAPMLFAVEYRVGEGDWMEKEFGNAG